ncbi:AcrR family transcriptional regulator [Nocardia transvalensis]|uniref:AcrR family transcriptional regulator n=1 Tax=Nocardia transvalensis TaxID=37333 RepID=A0A7W9PCW4_9NOCA|nr:TetR family transcriptional regulator [Nocardia transvalensis]MBB5913289.1 AcrR family transcriptional regulator [Nocardia transvalensis]
MSTPDRRARIADAAIDLIADQGLRALTHRALDTALELPPGSVSYYFRTKRALIEAVVDRITTRSRDDFEAAKLAGSTFTETEKVAHGIAVWLDELLDRRHNHLVARHTLIMDLRGDAALHDRLVACLFSHDHATALFLSLGAADPPAAAADFIALIEGLVFDRFAGARRELEPGTPESVARLEVPLRIHLAGLRPRPRRLTPTASRD